MLFPFHQVQECLEDHLDEPKFASDCKEELDAVIARRVADFRLNTVLREACAGDLQEHCAATLQVSSRCELSVLRATARNTNHKSEVCRGADAGMKEV